MANNNNNKQYRNTRLFRTETLAEELGLLAQESQLLAKQLKFDEPDTDKSVILDDKKALKRATTLKLVEKLTSETYQYAAAHLRVLFNTYRTYLTSKELMDMLLLRFNSRSTDVKLRVIVAFKTWVSQHLCDFDSDMIARFRQLTATIPRDQPSLRGPAELILKSIDRPVTPPMKHAAPGRNQMDYWSMKVEDLATALTAIEFDLFLNIKSHEFIKVAWTKEDGHIKAPNILYAIRHFNKMGEFVRTEILFGDTPSLRATHIKHFIDLAMQLQTQHNWNAFFAIIGTLESTPISRLKKTWAEVEKLKYMDTYTKLASIIQPTKNFAKYRDRLRATLPPAVPYLGLILNDVFFLDEGNKDSIGDLVNFVKCSMISDQIEQFQRFQIKVAKPYDEFTSTLKRYLHSFPTLEQEQDAYEESLKIEPKHRPSSLSSSSSSSARNSASTQPLSLSDSDEPVDMDLGTQRMLDSQQKKINFVHEPMTLYLKLLGAHTPTKVVLPSSYTAKEALVNFSRKLTGVTPSCSLVELPTNIIPDDAPLYPYTKSKTQVPLVIFSDPKIVNLGVSLDKSLKELKEMVLDLGVPLFSMLPLIQQFFELKDPFSFLYVEETRVARWLNINKTLDEQGFKTDKGLLLLYPLKNMLKENAAYKADADLTGTVVLRKADSLSPFATLKTKAKQRQYVALHDHFLLLFSSSEALVPKKVLSLEHFRVRLSERHHEIVLTRTFNGFYHNGKKGSSYSLTIPPSADDDEEDLKKLKQWFDKIQINCGLIGAQTIFGVALGNVAARRGPDNPIPLIIEQIIAFLLSMLSKEEEDCSKLFVVPGDATLLDFYRQHFDQGLKVEFTKVNDNLVNTVGQLLMSYLAELPNPLLTFSFYDQFIAYGNKTTDDYDELKRIVMCLPEPNRVVLCSILEFFSRISNRAEELGVIFGPIFLRPQPATPPSESPIASPTFPTPSLSISTNLTASVTLPPCDPAACNVVSRLILGYNSILSTSKDGILARRLIVKTRTKASTLSFGTNTELLPNGTVRSAKSDAVELASDFQKKRQRTLQNVENKKHEIEEMFKGKSGKSSLSLRHSNGHIHAKDVHLPPSPLASPSSSLTPQVDENGVPEALKLSASTSILSSSTCSESDSPKKPYFVSGPRKLATSEGAGRNTLERNKEKMLSELKKLNLEEKPTQSGSTASTNAVSSINSVSSMSESKRIHRRYGMSKLVCSNCRNAILNYDQDTCSNCGSTC